MDTDTYFRLRNELSDRFWREQPQVIYMDPVDGEVKTMLADEKEYVEYHMKELARLV